MLNIPWDLTFMNAAETMPTMLTMLSSLVKVWHMLKGNFAHVVLATLAT
jgi:hypothetical protein